MFCKPCVSKTALRRQQQRHLGSNGSGHLSAGLSGDFVLNPCTPKGIPTTTVKIEEKNSGGDRWLAQSIFMLELSVPVSIVIDSLVCRADMAHAWLMQTCADFSGDTEVVSSNAETQPHKSQSNIITQDSAVPRYRELIDHNLLSFMCLTIWPDKSSQAHSSSTNSIQTYPDNSSLIV